MAMDGDVSLNEREAGTTDYVPGTVVVRPLVVTYGGDGTAAFDPVIDLPESWRLLTGGETIVFDGGGCFSPA